MLRTAQAVAAANTAVINSLRKTFINLDGLDRTTSHAGITPTATFFIGNDRFHKSRFDICDFGEEYTTSLTCATTGTLLLTRQKSAGFLLLLFCYKRVTFTTNSEISIDLLSYFTDKRLQHYS